MLNNLYTFSVPVFLRGHAAGSELWGKGEAHAAGYKITPSALLTARLFPDMFPLTGQVQAACDTAKRATARLVGVEPPRFEDNEATFEELYARIQRTSEFVEKFQADAFRDADTRKIELKMSAGVVSLTAEKYLTRFALPNFYFHVTTAYNVLRHNGVTLGNRDYLGKLSQGDLLLDHRGPVEASVGSVLRRPGRDRRRFRMHIRHDGGGPDPGLRPAADPARGARGGVRARRLRDRAGGQCA